MSCVYCQFPIYPASFSLSLEFWTYISKSSDSPFVNLMAILNTTSKKTAFNFYPFDVSLILQSIRMEVSSSRQLGAKILVSHPRSNSSANPIDCSFEMHLESDHLAPASTTLVQDTVISSGLLLEPSSWFSCLQPYTPHTHPQCVLKAAAGEPIWQAISLPRSSGCFPTHSK